MKIYVALDAEAKFGFSGLTKYHEYASEMLRPLQFEQSIGNIKAAKLKQLPADSYALVEP